jgi:NitT/TauT family transport system ATP-binding protein
MARWGQTRVSAEALKTAIAVFRPDLYDAALGSRGGGHATRSIGAFDGPDFDPNDIAGYLASLKISGRNLT